MKLVRARPKRVEDLPEWAKCCATLMQGIDKLGELVIDVSSVKNMGDDRYCLFCKYRGIPASAKQARIVQGEFPGDFVTIDLLDIDEGPLGAKSAQHD